MTRASFNNQNFILTLLLIREAGDSENTMFNYQRLSHDENRVHF